MDALAERLEVPETHVDAEFNDARRQIKAIERRADLHCIAYSVTLAFADHPCGWPRGAYEHGRLSATKRTKTRCA